MTMNPSLRAVLDLSPFVLAVALTACGGTVIGGGGASSTTGPGTGNEGPPPGARAGIAFATQYDCGSTTASSSSGGWGGGAGTGAGGAGGYPGTGGGYPGTGGTGGYGGWTDGCGGNPGMLTLQIGDPAPTCGDPQISSACGGHFGVSIGIPPELQMPGAIPLSTPSLSTFFSETGAEYAGDPSSCPGGGGSFVSGTLVIQSIDAASVSFTLQGTQPFLLGAPSADGAYVVPRCY